VKKRLGPHLEYYKDLSIFGNLVDKQVAYSRIKTQNPKLPYLEIEKKRRTKYYILGEQIFSFYDANLLLDITIS